LFTFAKVNANPNANANRNSAAPEVKAVEGMICYDCNLTACSFGSKCVVGSGHCIPNPCKSCCTN
jgi:hypothetical protein